MSDITNVASAVKLDRKEDFKAWLPAVKAELYKAGCHNAIEADYTLPNYADLTLEYLALGYPQEKLDSQDIVHKAINEEWKAYKKSREKAKGIIFSTLGGSVQAMFAKDIPVLELWDKLLKTFEDRSPDTFGKTVWKPGHRSLADFTGIQEYIDSYSLALAEMSSICDGMTENGAKRTAETILQSSFIHGLGKDYEPFSLDVRKNWTWESTNLREIMTLASRYRTEESAPKQTLLTHKRLLSSSTPQAQKRQRAPPGSCTNQSCVDRNSTSHWPDKCWVTHPELRKPPFHSNKDKGKDKDNKGEPKYQS